MMATSHSPSWRGIAACGLAAVVVAASAAGPAARPTDAVREVVLARRNVMAAIGRNMDGITGMIEPGGTLDPADATEHADEIAVMLLAFPHLFPPGSDNWSAQRERDDPAGVSEAATAVWRERARFTALANAASNEATAASRASGEAEFRQHIARLDAQCNACHAAYRRYDRPYTMPIPPVAGR